jgi:hypothetical protein
MPPFPMRSPFLLSLCEYDVFLFMDPVTGALIRMIKEAFNAFTLWEVVKI